MKIRFVFIAVLAPFACALHSETVRRDSGNQLITNQNAIVQRTNGDKSAGERDPTQSEFTVDVYQNGQLLEKRFYREGVCVQSVTYDPRTRRVVSKINYFFQSNGDIDHLEVVQGLPGDSSDDMLQEYKHSEEDLRSYTSFLASEGIRFPMPDLASDESANLTAVLSVARSQSIAGDIQETSEGRTIKFSEFSQRLRMPNSPVAVLAGKSEVITIKSYELMLKRDHPTKEVYVLDTGTVVTTYSYSDEGLTGVEYRILGSGTDDSIKKRFVYHR